MSNEAQANTSTQEFSPLRSALWPIHGYEMKKFLPMSFLMFFILYVYTMIRDLKDVFVRTYAVGGGAELIPQLKLWFVMPAAFLLVAVYAALLDKFGFKKSFYIMITSFLAFFAVFILFLYPNRDAIHPGLATVRAMQASWPAFFYWIIPCITNWSYTLFYIMAELWGTMAISSLFWQFAYQITMKNEVKRYFGLYSVIGNLGGILSASLLKWLSRAFQGDSFVYASIFSSIGCGLVVMAIYWYMNAVTLKDPKLFDPSQIKGKKKKAKAGIMDGIKMLGQSRYVLMICLIVICYGVGVNFVEVIWKKCVEIYFNYNKNAVAEMQANLSIVTGIITIVMSLVGQNILRKTKWRTSALIPALVLTIFGAVFFGVVLYGKFASPTILGVSYFAIATWLGMVIDAATKGVKYCLFDATKNMAYLPLDEETKTKGQAAVEVIGGRAGKAGASTIQMVLTNVIAAGSAIMSHVVTISICFAATAIAWIYSVFNLSKKYEAKLVENASQEQE